LTGQTIADKMLFMAAAMERERTLDGIAAAQGRRGGRPPAVDDDTLAIALARRSCGQSVIAIAQDLGIGRSTLCRVLEPYAANAATRAEA
jgi:DNA invertase Pin-like site-specific DNA recombinase